MRNVRYRWLRALDLNLPGGSSQVSFQLLAVGQVHRGVAFLPFGRSWLKTAKPLAYEAEPETLSQHIRKRRCEMGLRQKDVAVLLNVDAWTVTNWEKGRTHPPIGYFPSIIEFLGYDPFPEPQTFGARLLAKRRRVGISRKRLARQLGIDEGTLARWEQDVSRPTSWRKQAIAVFLAAEG